MNARLYVRSLKPRSQRAKRDPGRFVLPLIGASVLVLGLMNWWTP